jgi:hypothetical protein
MEETNATIDPIVIETNETLLSILYFWMLAVRIAGLGLSRLGTTAWLDEKLFCWPGEIVYADGTPFRVYEDIIDDAYGWEESYSWNTNVKRIAVSGPKRRPNRNLLLRLQLWDAAFKIDADPIILPIE